MTNEALQLHHTGQYAQARPMKGSAEPQFNPFLPSLPPTRIGSIDYVKFAGRFCQRQRTEAFSICSHILWALEGGRFPRMHCQMGNTAQYPGHDTPHRHSQLSHDGQSSDALCLLRGAFDLLQTGSRVCHASGHSLRGPF